MDLQSRLITLNHLPAGVIYAAWTAGMFALIFARYVLTAGLAYLVCWHWARDPFARRRIDSLPRNEWNRARIRRQMRREFGYSVLTSWIFAFAGVAMILFWERGWTLVYLDPAKYGWAYFVLSFFIFAFLHDTYFYWVHRWMHRPEVFRRVHRVHHESKSPTPWAAFSFHPWESVLEALILPLLILIIPVHPAILLANLLLMTVFGVINHTGYELYPRSFASHAFWRYWVSATHHQAHHDRYRQNFGLYFNLWDRWMGTQHEAYELEFKSRTSDQVEAPL